MEHNHHMMDRQIFNLKLGVEATSAYILITAILGEGQRPDLGLIQGRWASSQQDLDQALQELTDRNVIEIRTGPDNQALYYPKPSAVWQW